VPAAAAGLALFVLVAVSSVRYARRRASYETWFGLHLYVYLAIALAVAPQLVVGSDLARPSPARLHRALRGRAAAASSLRSRRHSR
jgi:hypothetical protein